MSEPLDIAQLADLLHETADHHGCVRSDRSEARLVGLVRGLHDRTQPRGGAQTRPRRPRVATWPTSSTSSFPDLFGVSMRGRRTISWEVPVTTLHDRPNTALLVIDVQNGVVEGAPRRDDVIKNINMLVDKARAERRPRDLGAALRR